MFWPVHCTGAGWSLRFGFWNFPEEVVGLLGFEPRTKGL